MWSTLAQDIIFDAVLNWRRLLYLTKPTKKKKQPKQQTTKKEKQKKKKKKKKKKKTHTKKNKLLNEWSQDTESMRDLIGLTWA